MTKDSLKAAVERVAKRAAKQFAKRGQVPPVYLGLDGRGQEFVFSPPPELGKDETAAIVRAILNMHQASRVVVVTEAWMLASPKSEPPDLERLGRGGVRNQPGHVEVVLIMKSLDMVGHTHCPTVIVTRLPQIMTKKNVIISPHPWQRPSSGRFAPDIFDPHFVGPTVSHYLAAQ